ncbi:MAG: MarR family transcriptional regulator [Pirellulales bacterium]
MSTPPSLEDQIVVSLRRISRAIDLRSRLLLLEYGLTSPQLTTLHAVARLQPISSSTLAREIHVGQPTVTGILHRLEQRGLITRTRSDHDRRSVEITLTSEGQRMLTSAPTLLDEQFHRRLARLKDWERTQILSTLQHVADMMDAEPIDALALLETDLGPMALDEGLIAPPSGAEPGISDSTSTSRSLPPSLAKRNRE